MAQDPGPQFGKLIADADKRRDAIHVATAPVTAWHRVEPGQKVVFARDDDVEFVRVATVGEAPVGIVDPFLEVAVEAGQRFWMFVRPGTITGLRHSWTHPAFAAAEAARKGAR